MAGTRERWHRLRAGTQRLRARVRWWELAPLTIAVAMSIRSYRSDTHILFPDTYGFIQLTKVWPHGSVIGGFREPVWATLLTVPATVFDPETVVRVAGVVGFVALVLVVQAVARHYWGRAWGVGAAIAIAASPFLSFWAVQGLREETAAAGIVGFGFLVVRGPESRRDWLVLAGAAGVLAMFRWDTVMLTIPVLVIAAIAARVDTRTLVYAAALFAVIIAPFVIGNTFKYGDPLYSSNRAAQFYRNTEFHGQPGFPSNKVFRKNNFAGRATTWSEYLFEDHDLDELARRAVEGPVTSALTVTSYSLFYGTDVEAPRAAIPTLAEARSLSTLLPWLVVLLGTFGAVVMVRRGRWPFAALLLLAAVQHFPIVQLHNYDIRLEITVYVLLVLANVEALTAITARLRSREAAT